MFDFANLNEKTLLEIEYKKLKYFFEVEKNRSVELDHRYKYLISLIRRTIARRDNDPVNAEDKWIIPNYSSALALDRWFRTCHDIMRQNAYDIFEKPESDGRPRVALVLSGGVGDILGAAALPRQLVERFSCKLYIFSPFYPTIQIFKGNKYVSDIFILREDPFKFSAEVLQHLDGIDVIVESKYCISYKKGAKNIIPDESHEQRERRSHQGDGSEFHKFASSYFPSQNNSFGRKVMKKGLKLSDLVYTGGFSSKPLPLIDLPALADSVCPVFFDPSMKYITIHNGAGENTVAKPSSDVGYKSTKLLPMKTWERVVELLTSFGHNVVQLGSQDEEAVPGVKWDLRGLTSLSDAAALIKNAICHVDTEGGLVHLAKVVGQKCVVIFGPTPPELFGYDDNINLSPTVCRNCWWTTENWVYECPLRKPGPPCMLEHKAADIVDSIISFKEKNSFCSKENRGRRSDIEELEARNERLIFSLFDRNATSNEKENIISRLEDDLFRTRFESEGWLFISSRDQKSVGGLFLHSNTWHSREDWGVWGRGLEHRINLPLPEKNERCSIFLEIQLQLNIPQIIRMTSNGYSVELDGKVGVHNYELTLPPTCIDGFYLKVFFNLEQPFCPAVEGVAAGDFRLLGCGLTKIRYRYITH